jgi:positive regulator of sigma E activity
VVEIVPPVADQVTAVLLVPLTAAVNCRVVPVTNDADVGLMLTAISGGDAVTVTVAEADLLTSAALVALTVNAPAVLGAV